jgi:phenylacetate-CoA ligase
MFPQYGYVEFLPTDLTDETGARLFEIVATGFNNWVMPFVRYRTADYAIPADGFCTCGRHYPLIERVVGRSQEFLVGNEGQLFSVTALTSQFEKLSFIDEFIFSQAEPGKALLSIVPNETPSENALLNIALDIHRLSRGKLFLTVRVVDSISKTALGKRVYVNQSLDISKYLHPDSPVMNGNKISALEPLENLEK